MVPQPGHALKSLGRRMRSEKLPESDGVCAPRERPRFHPRNAPNGYPSGLDPAAFARCSLGLARQWMRSPRLRSLIFAGDAPGPTPRRLHLRRLEFWLRSWFANCVVALFRCRRSLRGSQPRYWADRFIGPLEQFPLRQVSPGGFGADSIGARRLLTISLNDPHAHTRH